MLATKNYQEFQVLSEDGTLVKTFTGSGHRCLPGDFVECTPDSVSLAKRNQPNPLVGTIHIQSKYLFGHTSRNIPIYLFFPYDTSYPPFRVGCSSREGKNKIGLIMFESWEKGETYPRGILRDLLGTAGDSDAEELALKYKYAPEWKKVAKVPVQEIETNGCMRKELHGFTFNIDPYGCKDIDDCLTIERQGELTTLTITIADLTELVTPGSELDRLAENQGSTLYSPDGEAIAPMLPRWISEEKASLRPGEVRRGLSLSLTWDGKELTVGSFFPSILHNSVSYSYESVYENKEISTLLTEITRCADSHKWIEHMMVLYNKRVAELFLSKDVGLLRKLDTMCVKRLEQKAAEYCLPSTNATHAGFQNCHYTHATSPIRRYADIVAQRTLMHLILTPDESSPSLSQRLLQNLNTRMKEASRFGRDLCFQRAVSKASLGSIQGTVLDWKESKGDWKVYLEIPEWNQIISLRLKGYEESDTLVLTSPDEEESFHLGRESIAQVKYYCDRTQPNWKKRMVFSLTN